jgi:hypothetical protein
VASDLTTLVRSPEPDAPPMSAGTILLVEDNRITRKSRTSR